MFKEPFGQSYFDQNAQIICEIWLSDLFKLHLFQKSNLHVLYKKIKLVLENSANLEPNKYAKIQQFITVIYRLSILIYS